MQAATGSSRSSAACAACMRKSRHRPSSSLPPASTSFRPTSARRCGSDARSSRRGRFAERSTSTPPTSCRSWLAARRAVLRSAERGSLPGAIPPACSTRQSGPTRSRRFERRSGRRWTVGASCATSSPTTSCGVSEVLFGSGCGRGSASSSASFARGRRRDRGSLSCGRISGSRAGGRSPTRTRRCVRSAGDSCAPMAPPGPPTSASGSPRPRLRWRMRGRCSRASLPTWRRSTSRVAGPLPSPATGRSRCRAAGCGWCGSTTPTWWGSASAISSYRNPVRELVAEHGRGRYEGPAGVRFVLVDGIAAGLWEREKRGKRIELQVRLVRGPG